MITINLSIEDDSVRSLDGRPLVWGTQHRITNEALKLTPELEEWLFEEIGKMRDKVLKEFDEQNGGER